MIPPAMTVPLMTILAATSPASERSAILDAARVPIVARLGKPVLFRVDRLTREGGWAFLLADLEDGQGRPIDYAGTPLAGAWNNGMVSKSCAVLLRREADGWTVVDSRIGPTDVAWGGWASQHRAPPSLFR